jgi:TolB-like protein
MMSDISRGQSRRSIGSYAVGLLCGISLLITHCAPPSPTVSSDTLSPTLPNAPADRAAPPADLPTSLVLGILPFDLVARSSTLQWLRQGLPELLATDLGGAGTVTVLDYARLAAIDRELHRQYHGHVDDSRLIAIGHQFGATLLLSGTIVQIDQHHIRIDLRVTRVETAAIVTTLSHIAPVDDLLVAEHMLALAILERLNAVPPASHLAHWHRPQPRIIPVLQAYHAGTEALADHRDSDARSAFTQALRLDPTYRPAQIALDDPRLAPIATQAWDPPTPTLSPLPQETFRAIDQLLRELIDYGLRIDVDRPHATTVLHVPLTVTLNRRWVDRFSDALPLLRLDPFVRVHDHGNDPAHALTAGPALSYFAEQLGSLTLILTFTTASHEPIETLTLCLGNGTHPGSPLSARLFPTPQIRLHQSRPLTAIWSGPQTLWPLLHTIAARLELNHGACRLAPSRS